MKIESTASPIERGNRWNAALRLGPKGGSVERFPHPPTLDGLVHAGAGLGSSPVDPRVVDAVVAYNRRIGHPLGAAAATRLADPRCLVVATGQQPGLFGGALLVAAKVIGALRISEELERATARPVVTLFWNHSEDHDLVEVNRCELFSGPSLVRRSLCIPDLGRCLDRVVIDDRLAAEGSAILLELGFGPHSEFTPRPLESWSEWSGRCLRAVLPESAVVHIEPGALRPLLAPFFTRILDREAAVGDAVSRGSAAAARSGEKPQVEVVDRSQLFVIDDDGARRRYLVDGGELLSPPRAGDRSGAELARWIRERAQRTPAGLSTNALLRPLAVQSLFPVVAHVNGPAEIAYFAQLPELFATLELPFPVVVPRPSLTLLRPKEDVIRRNLGLDVDALTGDPAAWPALRPSADLAEAFERARTHLLRAGDAVAGLVTDPGLERALAGYRSRLTDATDRFESTVSKDRERAGEVGKAQRHRLAEWVRPRGRPQERELGPLVLLKGEAPQRIESILRRLPSFDYRHHVVTLEEGDA